MVFPIRVFLVFWILPILLIKYFHARTIIQLNTNLLL